MIEVINKVDSKISPEYVRNILNRAVLFFKIKQNDISVAFIGRSEMRRINRIYRGRDKATDVLSFNYGSDQIRINGEILICPQIAREDIKLEGVNYKIKITTLLIHGLLHILGYDHHNSKDMKIMYNLQQQIISFI